MNKLVEVKNEDKIKLTRAQKNLVVRIVKGHVEDKNYFFSWATITINKYFVAVGFYYYPITAIDNPYVSKQKEFWIGPKGAIQRATTQTGIGKEHNIKKIAKYYFKAED